MISVRQIWQEFLRLGRRPHPLSDNRKHQGADRDFTFVVLNPKKEKLARILASLGDKADIRCINLLGLRICGFAETAGRAETALRAARKVPRAGIERFTKQLLLAGQYNRARRLFQGRLAAGDRPVAVCWNGLNGTRRVFMDAAKDAGAECLYFEHAPLPGRITADTAGVNQVNCLPRDIEPYRAWVARNPDAMGAMRNVADTIRQRPAVAKPSLPTVEAMPDLAEPFIFVPLQYQGDSQLRLFGGRCRTVEATIDAVCQAAALLPPGWHIRLKEHPSSAASFRACLAPYHRLPVFFDNQTDTFTQVRAARLVMTVNSSVGLEAMFFDKPVVTLGQAFWAIEGVAHSTATAEALGRVMQAPEEVHFDSAAREAFLSFLIGSYYPKLDQLPGGGYHMAEKERAKIRHRLNAALLNDAKSGQS